MMGKVWGLTSRKQEKNNCIEKKKKEFYKKDVFFLLQTESCVCTWDINQGTRLQNHPRRKVVWNCIEAEKMLPALKTEGWGKSEWEERMKMEE